MTRYCTLDFALAEADVAGTSKTTQDAQIFGYISAVSKRIDYLLQPRNIKRPFFAPYIESRPFNIRPWKVNTPNMTFDLHMFLLEFTAVLAGAENVTSKIRGYYPGAPPFRKLQINDDSCDTWYTLETSPAIRRGYPEPLTVTGTWGWHEDWTNAFTATSLVATNPILAADLTFDVTATEGALFSPGNMILIDSEYMEITSISTDTLTVTRGYNGSTATGHAVGAVVSILQIPDDIQRVTARQADLLFSRLGAFDVQALTTVGIVQYPQDLTLELENTVSNYRI
jgi:hypothetical protein